MDKFDFLKQHELFYNTDTFDNCMLFLYDVDQLQMNEIDLSYISIPLFPSMTLEWCYYSDGECLHCCTDDLTECPQWFQKLVQEAQTTLEFRERIRQIFR